MGLDFAKAFEAALAEAQLAAASAGLPVEEWLRATLVANQPALHAIASAVGSQHISHETAEHLFRLNQALVRDEAMLNEVTVKAQEAVHTFFAVLFASLRHGLKLAL